MINIYRYSPIKFMTLGHILVGHTMLASGLYNRGYVDSNL
jgi:hypothetical protein